MLVDLSALTQEQTWAVAYETQQRNKAIAQQNTHAEAYNASRPISLPEQPMQPVVTMQQTADELASTVGFEAAVQRMRNAKQAVMVPAYLAATLEVQSQIDSLLGVPPLIEGLV